ncbi:PREDICTED: putative phytosulfokines 6 isoform X2 [Lupinus angustifolius]|nr:PREDICTED: putative phytosulfokines 6 isoform X2 [Lupinus angustifolius]
MNLSFHYGPLFLFLFFLVPSSILCARPLATEQEQNMKLQKVSGEDFDLELEGAKSFKGLGMENCNSEDEECLVKRMTLEVHIDYIYTEHHKP